MGTLTLTTTAPQDARIVHAFGVALNLGRDATGPEVKAAVISYIVSTVRGVEAREAAEAAAAAVTPITPT